MYNFDPYNVLLVIATNIPVTYDCFCAAGTHVFRTCLSLYNFWKLIFDAFSEIMGLPIDPSPVIAIFGVTAQNMRLSSYNCQM